MNRKGVEFNVVQIEPGLWRWQFQIDETVTTGTAKTNLRGMAARRAEMRIDPDLKTVSSSPPHETERIQQPGGTNEVRTESSLGL